MPFLALGHGECKGDRGHCVPTNPTSAPGPIFRRAGADHESGSHEDSPEIQERGLR
ncbi:Uncharacterised protein [Mycobacteroides abscessus subsp. massiliense]|nr:Uncharacterised protein [Mycobacteroides abscessus subsp. massiliense]